jgi:hypothetical protein
MQAKLEKELRDNELRERIIQEARNKEHAEERKIHTQARSNMMIKYFSEKVIYIL